MGVGNNVDPLGEVLIEVLPEGLKKLFAPAAALPARLLVPLRPSVVLLVDKGTVVLLVAEAKAGALAAAEPAPVCATAQLPDATRAVARMIAAGVMCFFQMLEI